MSMWNDEPSDNTRPAQLPTIDAVWTPVKIESPLPPPPPAYVPQPPVVAEKPNPRPRRGVNVIVLAAVAGAAGLLGAVVGVALTEDSGTVSSSTSPVVTAPRPDGTVTNGQVMQLVVVPEPAAIGLVLLGMALAAVARRRK